MTDDMFYLESLRRYFAIYVTQGQYPEANLAFYKPVERYKNLGALGTRAGSNALADYASSCLEQKDYTEAERLALLRLSTTKGKVRAENEETLQAMSSLGKMIYYIRVKSKRQFRHSKTQWLFMGQLFAANIKTSLKSMAIWVPHSRSKE